ncbi:MAG: hypothetical protein SFX74_12200 [Fimbriimonadaceae bacterium]|nr:hypothetical protein [Fimbriimonadaceae bacterium]
MKKSLVTTSLGICALIALVTWGLSAHMTIRAQQAALELRARENAKTLVQMGLMTEAQAVELFQLADRCESGHTLNDQEFAWLVEQLQRQDSSAMATTRRQYVVLAIERAINRMNTSQRVRMKELVRTMIASNDRTDPDATDVFNALRILNQLNDPDAPVLIQSILNDPRPLARKYAREAQQRLDNANRKKAG